VLDLLTEGHDQLHLLCAELSTPHGPMDSRRRRARIDLLVATAVRHLSAEEQYLYPTVAAVLPDGRRLVEQEIAADLAIRRALARLHRAGQAAGEGLAIRALTVRLGRHAHQAAHLIFPRLHLACTDEELVRLGNRVSIALESAPTRPHLAAPTRPPWNKIIDPALGVVDKVRDVLTGRRTYPEL